MQNLVSTFHHSKYMVRHLFLEEHMEQDVLIYTFIQVASAEAVEQEQNYRYLVQVQQFLKVV